MSKKTNLIVVLIILLLGVVGIGIFKSKPNAKLDLKEELTKEEVAINESFKEELGDIEPFMEKVVVNTMGVDRVDTYEEEVLDITMFSKGLRIPQRLHRKTNTIFNKTEGGYVYHDQNIAIDLEDNNEMKTEEYRSMNKGEITIFNFEPTMEAWVKQEGKSEDLIGNRVDQLNTALDNIKHLAVYNDVSEEEVEIIFNLGANESFALMNLFEMPVNDIMLSEFKDVDFDEFYKIQAVLVVDRENKMPKSFSFDATEASKGIEERTGLDPDGFSMLELGDIKLKIEFNSFEDDVEEVVIPDKVIKEAVSFDDYLDWVEKNELGDKEKDVEKKD